MNDIHFTDNFKNLYNQSQSLRDNYSLPFSQMKFNNLISLTSTGYQGPIVNSADSTDIIKDIIERSRELRAITHFIRFNPFTENHSVFAGSSYLQKAGQILTVTIPDDFNEYYSQLPVRTRNAFRKTSPLKLKVNNRPDNSIILQSLQYNNQYITKPAHIRHLIDNNLAVLYQTYLDNEEIAASLFLRDRNTPNAYYIANVSTEAGKINGANVFLLLKFIENHIESNVKNLGLGGGIAGNDSLHKFKSQFATDSKPVYHMKLIIDSESFNRHNIDNGYFPSWMKDYSPAELI